MSKNFIILTIIILMSASCSKSNGSKKNSETQPRFTVEPIESDESNENNNKSSENEGSASPTLTEEELLEQENFNCNRESSTLIGPIADSTLSEDSTNIILKMNPSNVQAIINKVTEATNQVPGAELTPQFFWTLLSSEIENSDNSLAEYLNLKLIKLLNAYPENDFEELRKVLAFILTYIVTNPNLEQGISVNYGGDRSLTLVFNDDINNVRLFEICDESSFMNQVFIPTGMFTSEEVKGLIECSTEEHKLDIVSLNFEELRIYHNESPVSYTFISTELDQNDRNEHLRIRSDRSAELQLDLKLFKQVESRRRRRFLGRLGGRYKYTYHDDLFDKLNIEIKDSNHEVKIEELECVTTKAFSL